MNKTYTCIICPNGCEIDVKLSGDNIDDLNGALCKRGKEYVEQELHDPRRNIASLVLVENGEIPLVSVRLTNSVPKDKIFGVMKEIRALKVQAPVRLGDVLIKNVLDLNSNVIATKNVGIADL